MIKDNVRLPLDELVIEVARLLGFQRTGTDLQAVIGEAIKAVVGITFQRLDDGSLMMLTTD